MVDLFLNRQHLSFAISFAQHLLRAISICVVIQALRLVQRHWPEVFLVFVQGSIFHLNMPYRPQKQIFQKRHHLLLKCRKTRANFFEFFLFAQSIEMNLNFKCFFVFFSNLRHRRLRKSPKQLLDVANWPWKDIVLVWFNQKWILRYLLKKLLQVKSPLLKPYLFCVVAHNSFVWNTWNGNSRPSFLKFFVQRCEFFVSSISVPFAFWIKPNTLVFHVIPYFGWKAYCVPHFHLRFENVILLLKEVVA